jgi:hypothetical protein
MAKERRTRAQTCPLCQIVLAERSRRNPLYGIPLPKRVREGSYVHLLVGDNSYLCGYSVNKRRKSEGGRKVSLLILLLLIGFFFGLAGLVTAAKWLLVIAAICWLVGFISFSSQNSRGGD